MPQHLVVYGRRAAQLAQSPRFRLPDAEQRDDIAAIGVKTQKLVGQRAGIGGEKRARLPRIGQRAVSRADIALVVPRHVADLAHDLAGAVRVDERADVPAEPGIKQLQFVPLIAAGVEAAQQQQAASILQLGANVFRQRRERREREIRRRHRFPA